MKHRITATAAVLFGLAASPAIAQDETAPKATETEAAATGTEDAPKAAAAPAEDPLKDLSAEQRVTLQKLLTDASTYIGGIRIQEAFEKIIEAEQMAPNLFQIHNLKGAAYTKIRDFEKARVSFKRSLELNPGAFMSRFNITELDFVEHKFADAEKNFQSLLDDSPKMNAGTRRLIEFKILICQLSQDKDAEAKATHGKFGLNIYMDEEGRLLEIDEFDEEAKKAAATTKFVDYLDNTPAYYFGNAAFAFDKGDEDEARGWIRAAERTFSPQDVSVYIDSFIEMGWIDNLQ